MLRYAIAFVTRMTVISAIGLVAAACSEEPDVDEQPVLPFDSVAVRLIANGDTVLVRAELAVSKEQKTLGLMERKRLPADAGMLFVYDSTQGADAGFWMYRTRIPLDIAFIDSTGVIRSILAMQPCNTTLPEGCPTYPPNVPYKYALEVNAGFFDRQNIHVGDVLMLQDLSPR